MNERQDSLDKYYKPVDFYELVSSVLFWFIAGLSLTILYVEDVSIRNVLSRLFILLTIAFFLSNNYLKIYLIPNAENRRRVHLLSNAFDVCLDYEVTKGYYNNTVQPSLFKLGANVFENSLFAKTVVSEMLITERRKTIAYFFFFILSLLYKGIDISAVAIVAQTLFLSEVLSRWIYMECLKRENDRIFDDMNKLFINYTEEKKSQIEAQIIDSFVRYESVKAYCGIKQSSKIFFELNEELSKQWEQIKQRLKIDEKL